MEAMVSQLIHRFQDANYLVEDHHIFGCETHLIRLNNFLVQIHQSCVCMQLRQQMKQIYKKKIS